MTRSKLPKPPKPLTRRRKYRLKFVPSAWSEWGQLDGSVKETLKKLLTKRLDNPHVPGGELRGELRGYYKIKLLKQGDRLVYGVEDDAVVVMAVDKREDGLVYRAVLTRIEQLLSGLSKQAAASDDE